MDEETETWLQKRIRKHDKWLEMQKHIDCGPHPDTHSWDGETVEFENGWSVTCSKCGITACSHGMMYGP